MKHTAVEWLVTILEGQKDKPFNYNEWQIAFDHAKEMEKQQIIEAHGNKLRKSRGTSNCEVWVGGIDYYNETFKS